MTIPQDDIKLGPACARRLIGQLGDVADAFQAGRPLGPYLIETLLEDVELCPALEQTDDDGPQVQLGQALEKTRNGIRVAMACPSVKRDWAVQELRTLISDAQDCLDQWTKCVLAASGKSNETTCLNELARIDSPRCRICTFAGPELTDP